MLSPQRPRPDETKEECEKRILAGRQNNESELEYQKRFVDARKKAEIEEQARLAREAKEQEEKRKKDKDVKDVTKE